MGFKLSEILGDEVVLTSSVATTQYQFVAVTFLTADTDYDIAHTLAPPTPEDVDYLVVKKDRACDVYNDNSGTRRAWGKGYITLRCTITGATVTLLLTTRRNRIIG